MPAQTKARIKTKMPKKNTQGDVPFTGNLIFFNKQGF
jgi:hypothetical protein